MSKLDKAAKTLGPDTITEMEALDETELKKRIVAANEAMRQVSEELEANEKYTQLREDLKAITAGKREVNKRQGAVIEVALSLLSSKGAVS